MKQLVSSFLHALFREELELRVKIFHVLAIAGVLICVTTTVLSIVQDMALSVGINASMGLVSLGLLVYSARGGRPELCYWVTVVCIFLILFPSLFVFGGGYKSGMVFAFVLAVVFTVYMLDGWKMIAVTVFELTYYACLCVYAYLHPEQIHPFASELDTLIDVVVGLVVVSIALGATMFAQFKMYQKQQSELERARAEAEVANRAKSSFLANMSHEIRTPIHMITSINELMREEAPDEKTRAYANKTMAASEMLQSLVDNILDMSKIEAGKTEIVTAPYSTADLMQVLELAGQTRCSSKNLKFHCAKRDLPPYLSGDVAHIQQIAINLLSNAAKYTNSGSVSLSVSCKANEAAGEALLCIVVADTGIRIDPEDTPALFDAFTRADAHSRQRIEGTGLGLAIVKELCRLMGGSIRVESQRGWGSTFTVEIPQTLTSVEPLANATEEKTFVAPQARVLVVDDNAENLSVMRELLRRTQMHVDIAASGKAAVDAVARNAYDAIILDYMMPDMDGLETLRHLKKLPAFNVPVIALTADASAETRELLLEAGFAEYLAKPVSRNRLESALVKHLPEELVTIMQGETESLAAMRAFCGKYQPLLDPYHIDLRTALPFFDEKPQEYLLTAQLLLDLSPDELERLAALQNAETADNLVYAAHALKGKAKNLGLQALAREAEHVEKLCRNGYTAEARSLLPHLLYLYHHALEGLTLLTAAAAQPHANDESLKEGSACGL